MGIFNAFKETLFVKETSNTKQKIQQLNEIKEQIIEQDLLKTDLAYASLNMIIEGQMEYVLKKATIGMYVLHDINMTFNDLTDTIDYAIITPAHCYLVECKNMFGNIVIDQLGRFIREYELDGQMIKEEMVSPYEATKRHKEVLKKKWQNSQNILMSLIKSDSFDEYYVPLVVFSYPNSSLDTRSAPYDVRSHTIALSQLIAYLQRDLQSKDFLSLDSQKTMQQKADLLMSVNTFNELDFTTSYTKIEKPRPQIDTKALAEKLVLYRKQKAAELNMPEYQIYSDLQIKQIIELLPKDMIELQGSYILEPFRLDLHGVAILNMVQGHEVIVEKKSEVINNTVVEKDDLLNPEQVLYVDQFASKIDIKNENIVKNYGISSIQKCNTITNQANDAFTNQKNTLQANLEQLINVKKSVYNCMIEIYMYKKAGEKALINSKSTELVNLKNALDNSPGIANELAYSNYQKTLAIFESQMKNIQSEYQKMEKINHLLDEIIEKQTILLELIK